ACFRIDKREANAMSLYNGSYYDPYVPPPRRPAPTAWWVLPALLVPAVVLAAVAYLWWLARPAEGLVPGAQPRAVTARGDLATDEQSTIDLFKAVAPSVVHVTNLAVQRDPYSLNAQAVPRGTGTGFIWDTNGFVVTNYHVVEGASAARVILADHSS